MGCSKEDWAVFWCSLLSPLRLGEVPEARRERYFQQLSREERLLPDGQRKRISVRTLRRQWRRLKKEGVPGLYRRARNDRGKPRKKRGDLLARAVALTSSTRISGLAQWWPARMHTLCWSSTWETSCGCRSR